jgi:hypothetical protein
MRYKYSVISPTILMHLMMVKLDETFRAINVLNKEIKLEIIKNSVAVVRKRTIPTERPPLVREVSAKLCG